MANVLVDATYLQSIADAIRSKNGTQNTYKPSQMADAITNIPSGGITPTGTINITANGTHDVTNYASANVSVPNSYTTSDVGKVVNRDRQLVEQMNAQYTANGTYDTTLVGEVVVNVPSGGSTPTGTKQISITQNGTTTEDVANYANAEITVNVQGGSSRLPSGYTEIESVKLTGTQYINTGLVPVKFDNFRVKFKPTQLTSTGDTLFSIGTGSYQTIVLMYVDNTFAKYFRNGTALSINPYVVSNKEYELFLTNGDFFVVSEGDTMSHVGTTYVGDTDGTDKNLYIGRRANGQTPFHGYIQSFVVVNNSTGEYKLNLVPCIRDSDSKVGFYDLVSDSFIGSSGGDFIAGE